MAQGKLEEEKKALIEELGITLEQENLAPVAARILVTLILDGSQGTTFDTLVKDLKASKSTVSTHLDYLQLTGKVEYFTKPGDRKRYFIISPGLMLKRVDRMIANWDKERKLNEKIMAYKQEWNKLYKEDEFYHHDLEFQKYYLTFLNEAGKSIEKLRTKIKEKHLTNHNR